ncbi:MAG: ATP-binding protein [Clostridia bacterium]
MCAGQPLQEAGIRLSAIDHFGLHDPTPLQADDSYELVCERYRSGSLMAVSDRTPKDWYALFPNPVLAEGALDRLIDSSHYVLMEGKSHRPLWRPDRGRASSNPCPSLFPVDKEEVVTSP